MVLSDVYGSGSTSHPATLQKGEGWSLIQVPGQREVPEAEERDVAVIHQGEDQRDIPALVGQAFEGAEVGHRVVKSAERKKGRGRLRPGLWLAR